MKKRLLLILTTMTLAFVLAACSANENTVENSAPGDVTVQEQGTQEEPAENDEPAQEDDTAAAGDSAAVLNAVWNAYGEDQKFATFGGDMNHAVDGAAGIYSLEEKDGLSMNLLVKEDMAPMIDEAASLIHAMNANIFTSAAFHLTDAGNAQAFADAMKENIINNQWMCGSPDQFAIYSVNDEYIVMVFGAIEMMDVFKEKFTQVYGDAQVIYEGNVAQ